MIRLACALVLLALPAAAQVSGRVVDPAGAPIPGATVELWTANRRVAVTLSDSAGRFSVGEGSSARTVTAVRIGFQSATAPAQGDVVLRLAPQPLLLDGVRVVAREPRLCPNREDPRARALWEQARARYAPLSRAPRVSLEADRYEATVPRDRIGDIAGLTPYRDRLRREDLRQAGPAGDGLVGGAYARLSESVADHWEYAPLAWGLNPHFVSARFGALHRFSLLPARPGLARIAFCPLVGGGPAIQGVLTMDGEGTLLSSRWSYRVPRPRSEAGGEVDYLPPAEQTGGLLLARRSLFWRSWRGRYHFREDRYTGWEVAPAAPHLPTGS